MKKVVKAAVLVTPIVLMSLPVTAEPIPQEITYSHVTQRTSGDVNGFSIPTSTFGGTQTFDYRGQPSDSDSDKD